VRTAGGENRKTTALIDAALKILAEQNPMTIRQLFYRLVSVNVIPNDLASYQRVSEAMTKSRDDGRCPFGWIADRSRPIYEVTGWEDASAYMDTMRDGYRKNFWETQPEHIEIWVEKDAIIGSIEDVCKDLGVTIRVGRGYWSTTAAHNIAEYFATVDKPITAFYLGDHDPSGVDISRDLEERVRYYGEGDSFLEDFTLKRLAIHKSDIATFNLPPLPLKKKSDGTDSDPRAAKFRREHGTQAVELDALPPVELRRRIEEAVKEHTDKAAWDEAVAEEIIEKGRIADAVNQFPSMTDEEAPTWAQFQSLQDDEPYLWRIISDPDPAGRKFIVEIANQRTPLPDIDIQLAAVYELLAG
jgi:hypothetical protein